MSRASLLLAGFLVAASLWYGPSRSAAAAPIDSDGGVPPLLPVVADGGGPAAVSSDGDAHASSVDWTPCGLTGSASSTIYLPNITKTLGGPSGWDTPFYVQNTGNTLADVSVSFYRFSDGGLVTCRAVRGVSGGESIADDPNADADLPDNTQFSVVISSFGAPVIAVVDQLQGSGASTEALSYSGFSTGATKLYLPNVTRRFYGYDVPFIVQNMGTSLASVSAHFVSFDGSRIFDTTLAIAPGRSGVVDPDYTDGLVDGTQYAVTLTSTQPVGVVVNAHNEAIGPVAFSHNGLATGGTTLYAPYAMKSGPGGIFSPVVVQNVGTSPVDATLSFSPLDSGGAAQTFVLSAIAAGSSRAFDPRFQLGTTTPCTSASPTCLGNGEYSLTITAATPIAAVVLPNSSTTAAGYMAASKPDARSFLPIVQRTLGGVSGWTGTIYLQSATATAATLRFYRTPGYTLDATQFVTLTAGVTKRIDPRTVSGLRDGNTYAVIAEAGAGSLTSIVFEQAGVGGDAAMIYEGTSAPAATGPFIHGTVSGPSGAVAGVQVDATAGGWYINSTATDATGKYALSIPPNSTVSVRFTPPASSRLARQYYSGVTSNGESTPVPVGTSDVAGINAALVPAYNISGRVSSRTTGAAIPGAFVYAYRSSCSTCGTMLSATTDAFGSYVLPVPAGTYRVHFVAPEGVPNAGLWWSNGTTFSTATDVAVNGDVANINGSLAGLYRLMGTARDSMGRGVPGVTVRVRLGGGAGCCTTYDITTTDISGAYAAVLPAGTYRVSYIPTAGTGLATTWYGTGATAFSTASDVVVAGDVSGIDATLAAGRTLFGATTYQGTLFSGITVGVYLATATCCDNLVYLGSSDVYGTYAVGLAPGSYKVYFSGTTGGTTAAKWYATATSFSTATTITIGVSNVIANLALP